MKNVLLLFLNPEIVLAVLETGMIIKIRFFSLVRHYIAATCLFLLGPLDLHNHQHPPLDLVIRIEIPSNPHNHLSVQTFAEDVIENRYVLLFAIAGNTIR